MTNRFNNVSPKFSRIIGLLENFANVPALLQPAAFTVSTRLNPAELLEDVAAAALQLWAENRVMSTPASLRTDFTHLASLSLLTVCEA